jgi:hypothetical protein
MALGYTECQSVTDGVITGVPVELDHVVWWVQTRLWLERICGTKLGT